MRFGGFGFDRQFGFSAPSRRRAATAAPDVTAPTITSSASVSVAENSVLAHTLTANEPVTWSIRTSVQNGASVDYTHVELSGSVVQFLGNGTKDFEAPDDTGANNTYVFVVRATDGASNTTDQTITVTVTDVSEGGGGDLITNGGFDDDTIWEATNDDVSFNSPTISGGQAHFTGGTHSNTQYLGQVIGGVLAGDYEVTLDADVSVTVSLIDDVHAVVGFEVFAPGTAVTHVISASDTFNSVRLEVALEDGFVDNVTMFAA